MEKAKEYRKKRVLTSSWSYLLLALVSFASCNEKLMEPPKDLIPHAKMVEILRDLAVVNAAKTTNATILRDKGIEPMTYVLEKHGIDSIQFVESDRYYASLPVQYESIYKAVETKLEKEKEILEEAKKNEDSLRLIEMELKQEKIREKKQRATDSLAKISGNKTK